MHDLTKDPLPRLLATIAIPSAIGYFFSTMYNVVDNYYAGHLGGEALAALGRCFPVFFLFIITVDVGLSIGLSALVSTALGAKDRTLARLYTAQGLGLGIGLACAMVILGWFASPWLLRLLGAEDAEHALAMAYMLPILLAGWFIIVGFTINGALQATGDTVTVGTVSAIGFVANIGLNAWFIHLGFGLTGIAYATLLITAINFLIFAWRLWRSGLFDRSSFKDLWPRPGPMAEVLQQSMPATLSMTTVAVGIVIITYYAGQFGSDAVAAYITATRIEQLVLLPCIGMNAAVLAITGQNAGAGQYARARRTLVLALRYGSIIMVVGGILVWFTGRWMMSLFTESEAIIDIGTTYLHITILLFPGYMILFLVVAYLQGLKKPMFALWMGIYRQICAPILLFSLLLFVFEMPLPAIWWGVFAINWSGAFVTLAYAWQVSRKLPADLEFDPGSP